MKRFLPLVLLLAGCASEEADPLVGSTAPDIKLETLSIPSSSVSLAKRRGKAVLIDFWATWCGPCRQISPMMESVYAKYKEKGLEAMAITDEARETVTIFEKTHPHQMPVYLDSSSEASKKFGIQGLPTIVVVDRKGHIVFKETGFSEPNEFTAQVEAAVEEALKE